MRRRRILTWFGLAALVVGAVLLVDVYASPMPAVADEAIDAGQSLTKPIPPVSEEDRAGNTRNLIGWTHAKNRMNADMPMGRDIPVGQVEGMANGGYLADTRHRDLPGTGFIPESGKSALSGHATGVATHIAGPQSAGQGVRAVHAWAVSDWMGQGYLKTGTAEPPKGDHPARVFNHSWIGSGSPVGPLILRRVDYLVDTHDVIIVCGVDNKPGEIPDLLASAYNVISVGCPNDPSSDALTTLEGPGRSKPELVAPGDKTSWTTAVVTGVVAALLEFADRKIEEDAKDKDAARSEVIKAVLFAGARRPAGWTQLEGEPLDRKLGAGIVEIDRSLVILDAGHATPDAPTNQRYGWSFAPIDAKQVRSYDFTLDVQQGESSFALVWHRKILGGTAELTNPDTGEKRTIWNSAQFTPNLELGLVRKEADGSETLIAASISEVDNIELIHLPELDPGNYTLRIARKDDGTNQPWDYAVAWRIEANTE